MKTENRRQFIHFLFGSVFIALLITQGTQTTLIALSTIFVIGLAISYTIKKGVKIPGLMSVVKRVERDYEKHLPGKGALLFFAGAIVTMVLFQRQEVVLGALIVAIYGDAASTVIGIRFGKHRIADKKTIEGTIGGIITSLVFLSFIYPIPIAAAAAITGMLAELLPIDDNFTIPIAVGTILHFLIP